MTPTPARDLTRQLLATGHTLKGIAAGIGYSRVAVSLWWNGRYPADTRRLEAEILRAFAVRACPHDGLNKAVEDCARSALRPRPCGFPDAEAQWLACQACPHKPNPPSLTPSPSPARGRGEHKEPA